MRQKQYLLGWTEAAIGLHGLLGRAYAVVERFFREARQFTRWKRGEPRLRTESDAVQLAMRRYSQ